MLDLVWRQWSQWCCEFECSPWLHSNQATHSEQLALFAVYCWSRPPVGLGNAPDTVLSKISAISWYHRLNLGYSVGLHPGHQLAVQGMRRLSAPPAARAPTTIPVLHTLRSRCDFSLSHDRVLWGAALLGHFYLLRSSEYLAVNGTIAATAITVADITFRDGTGRICGFEDSTHVVQADVRLRGSKTDQEGRTKTLSLTRSGSGWLCPVLAVLDLVEHARVHGVPQSAPLTTTSAGKPVKASTLIARLRQAAIDCGIEPSRMGTHSLRVGGATAMMAAGVDVQTIKQFGRWASDSVDRYTRLTTAATRTLAAQMAGRDAPDRRPNANQGESARHAHH